jgi:hypothetical protein
MSSVIPTYLEEAFLKLQSTFDTFETIAATDAVSPVQRSLELEPIQEVSPLNEAVGTQSYQGGTLTQRGASWKGTFKVKPQAAGTAPDIGELLKHAMGVETVVGGTSVGYTFSDTVTPDAVQIVKHLEGYMQETISGGWVNDFTIKCARNEDPTIEFNGGAARYGRIVKDVIGTGDVATSATSCPLNDASRGSVIEPCIVQIGDDTNSASGYLVTAHDDTAGSADFTFSPGLAGAGESAGEDILPLVPATRTEGGTVLGGVNHSLTIDGVSLGFIEATIKVTTGLTGRDKEATTDRATGISKVGERVIEFEISGILKTGATGSAPLAGRAFDLASHDIDLTIGSASAARMKISIPAGEARVNATEHPENEDVMLTISGRAKQSAAAADEMSILLD